MKRLLVVLALATTCFAVALASAQSAPPVQVVKGPDERFKADILLVVAHPDDEGGVTPYLARAIYDEHKRVAVVYTTRGGSGGEEYKRGRRPRPGGHVVAQLRRACE